MMTRSPISEKMRPIMSSEDEDEDEEKVKNWAKLITVKGADKRMKRRRVMSRKEQKKNEKKVSPNLIAMAKGAEKIPDKNENEDEEIPDKNENENEDEEKVKNWAKLITVKGADKNKTDYIPDKNDLIPVMAETSKQMMMMMMSPISEKIPLKRKRPMSSEDEDEEIPLKEVYKRIKTRMRQLMSPKKPIPVYQSVPDIYDLHTNWDEVESDEEIVLDGCRPEVDYGFKYVINEQDLTYTRVTMPRKIYRRVAAYHNSALHDKTYPVETITKMALDRYNAIEITHLLTHQLLPPLLPSLPFFKLLLLVVVVYIL